MRRANHFNAEIELADGSKVEIKGGWKDHPDNWNDMLPLARETSLIQMAACWMDGPKNIKKLLNFQLAA